MKKLYSSSAEEKKKRKKARIHAMLIGQKTEEHFPSTREGRGKGSKGREVSFSRGTGIRARKRVVLKGKEKKETQQRGACHVRSILQRKKGALRALDTALFASLKKKRPSLRRERGGGKSQIPAEDHRRAREKKRGKKERAELAGKKKERGVRVMLSPYQ